MQFIVLKPFPDNSWSNKITFTILLDEIQLFWLDIRIYCLFWFLLHNLEKSWKPLFWRKPSEKPINTLVRRKYQWISQISLQISEMSEIRPRLEEFITIYSTSLRELKLRSCKLSSNELKTVLSRVAGSLEVIKIYLVTIKKDCEDLQPIHMPKLCKLDFSSVNTDVPLTVQNSSNQHVSISIAENRTTVNEEISICYILRDCSSLKSIQFDITLLSHLKSQELWRLRAFEISSFRELCRACWLQL